MTVGDSFTVDAMGTYTLNNHFWVDAGLPLHFTRYPSYLSNSPLTANWENGIGEPFARLGYSRALSGVNYTTMLIGYAPVGSYPKGLDTGRVGADWFNHVEATTHKFTPFGNVDLANGLFDRPFMAGPYEGNRPFQTVGFVSQFEGGVGYAIHRHFTVGGSAFEVVPGGRQKIFSRLVAEGTFIPGPVTNNRFFENQFETAGPSTIVRDDGFTGWGVVRLNQAFDVMLGYTRSVHYGMNSLGVTLAYNPTSITRLLWH